MLQDEITIVIDNERTIELSELSPVTVNLDLRPYIDTVVDFYPEASVLVDPDTIPYISGVPLLKYGRVGKVFTFIKSVLGRKTTFGRSAFTITNHITTLGQSETNPLNSNPVSIPIIFTKSVSGTKTTFARIAFAITDNISVNAQNVMGNANFYGEGLYSDGLYNGSDDPVTFFGLTSMGIGFGAVVSGTIVAKQTSIAEISLASYGVPAARINHSIKIRARTTTGSTGYIKAALYEGGVNRSGDITVGPLTNSLADYTLTIPNVSAAAITDYSNLSIRFWGYNLVGAALTFEISDIYLELPSSSGATTRYGAISRPITFVKNVSAVSTGPVTHYGVVSRTITFGKAVSGFEPARQTSVAEISLASHGTPSTRTNHSIKVRARTTTGSTGVIKAALYEGSTNRSGDLVSATLNTSLTDYTLTISDSAAATISSYSNLSIRFWGYDSEGNALIFEVAQLSLELPTS